MVKVKLKFTKAGNRYVLAIPKALIESGILNLEQNKEYEVEIKSNNEDYMLETILKNPKILEFIMKGQGRDLNPN